jgi:flagellar hook-associated protein 2
MSMSVDGLVSGMDTTSLITQLLQAEAGPQTALKTRLSSSQTAASAYRTVNTTFLAITAAAEAALKPDLWTSAKGTSSSPSVAVSVGASPVNGSLGFTVQSLAAAHSVVDRDAAWTSATSAYGASSIEVFDGLGVSKGTIPIGGTQTLADAATAINASTLGLSAAVVQVRGGATPEYALQVSSKTSGADSTFSLTGAGTFGITSVGADAELKIGDAAGAYSVYSSTNTFDSVLSGATLTVSKADPAATVTVSVASDPDAVAGKIAAMVDAVNAALSTVKTYTSNAPGSTAALKGDSPLTQLAGRVLDAVSSAIGSDGSPARVGFQLTKDGKITFDKAKFVTALKDDPALAMRMVSGTPAGNGPDGLVGGGDDIPEITGIAGKLLALSKSASDSTTGSIVALANGQDSLAKDYKDRIANWDLRLAKRKEMLTRQFTAMETALSSLKNQSTWLAGQINSLPSSS